MHIHFLLWVFQISCWFRFHDTITPNYAWWNLIILRLSLMIGTVFASCYTHLWNIAADINSGDACFWSQFYYAFALIKISLLDILQSQCTWFSDNFSLLFLSKQTDNLGVMNSTPALKLIKILHCATLYLEPVKAMSLFISGCLNESFNQKENWWHDAVQRYSHHVHLR